MKINRVENFSHKSFINYTGPDKEFKKKNIIFGYNGRGKSSLVFGIINKFMLDSEVERDNYRLFDCDYIKRNLILKDSSNPRIKGVFANFGERNVDIEYKISELESQIVDVYELESDIEEINIEIRTEIDKIHDDRKGNSKINKKKKDEDNKKVIAEYKEDLKNARAIEPDDNKLANIRGDSTLNENKQKMETISIPTLVSLPDELIDNVAKIFDKKFKDLQIPSSKIIEWMNEGLGIHTEGDKCKFCGGALNLKNVEQKVNEYNTNERQVAIAELKKFLEYLNRLKVQLESLLNNKVAIATYFGDDTEVCFTVLESAVKTVNKYLRIVNEKNEDMSSDIMFDAEDFREFIKIIESQITELRRIRKEQMDSISEKIVKLDTLVKGAIGLEIEKSTFINKGMESVEEKQRELDEIRAKNKELKSQIKDFKRQKSNTKDFADHINEVLAMLEINLKFSVEGDNYLIKHSETNETLSLEDISEGEKNLLSLLYFYYELFEDKLQRKLKSGIQLIIIDDPISSVDDINKMYILELTERIRDLKGDVQVFIFTHVWEDFCNLCYRLQDNDDTPYRFYEIKKDNNGSRIDVIKTRETPYRHAFNEINDFAKRSNCNDLNDCETYHYPNVMRKVLEGFLSFKTTNSSPTRNNLGNITSVLCDGHPDVSDERAIGMMLNVCNILSHEHARNPDEILKSAKYLMRKIWDVDRRHFAAMTEGHSSVSSSPSNENGSTF